VVSDPAEPYVNTLMVYVPAAILILAGIAFKLGVAPFHMWVPDFYEGTATHRVFSLYLYLNSLYCYIVTLHI
jgi:NADH:ubiquinone oxidoreductase subunit 2 (subunit N)